MYSALIKDLRRYPVPRYVRSIEPERALRWRGWLTSKDMKVTVRFMLVFTRTAKLYMY